MTILDTPVFTLAPIALWLEDFSEIKNSLSCGAHKAFRIYVAIYWKIQAVSLNVPVKLKF